MIGAFAMGDPPADQEEEAIPVSLNPEDLEMSPEEIVLGWAAAIDALDYLSLLRLPTPSAGGEGPSEDEVRRAFHRFAEAFHPDRHRGSPLEVQAAAATVFLRGTEAYRVLLDPLLGKRYLRLLHDEGAIRLPRDEVAQSIRPSSRHAVERVEDVVRSAAALPFARRADQYRESGDLKQARLQVQLAVAKDPQNPRLEELLRELDERIRSTKPA